MSTKLCFEYLKRSFPHNRVPKYNFGTREKTAEMNRHAKEGKFMNCPTQRSMGVVRLALLLMVTVIFYARLTWAQKFDFTVDGSTIPCGEYEQYQPIIWYG